MTDILVILSAAAGLVACWHIACLDVDRAAIWALLAVMIVMVAVRHADSVDARQQLCRAAGDGVRERLDFSARHAPRGP